MTSIAEKPLRTQSALSGPLLLSICVGLLFFNLSALAQEPEYVPGEVIVKLKTPSGSAESYSFLGKVHSKNKLSLTKSFNALNMHHFKSQSKTVDVKSLITEISKDPNVEYAEPNYILKKSQDAAGMGAQLTAFEMQQLVQGSGYSAAGLDSSVVAAWSVQSSVSGQSASRPIVAVIDTGLDLNHTVFVQSNAVWVNTDEIAGNGIDDDGNGYVDDRNGWNFVDDSSTIYDDDRHGTHVAGIILSVDQDIYNSPFEQARIQIMPLKFLNGSGVGSTSDAIQAIYYAVNNGAKILNNSWGGTTYSAALHEAVAYSYTHGTAFVAAAGNAGTNNDVKPMYPASYDVPNVIAVAATYSTWDLASFSNYGAQTVHLGARGYSISSTVPGGGYGNSSGTSMSAPFVTGTAAQMKAESPNMLGYQIKSIIFAQTTAETVLSNKVYTGGHLEAADSITYASNATVDSSQPPYYASYSSNRELASALSGGGGGCGMVAKLISNYDDPNGPPPGPQAWYVVFLLGLLAAPMFLLTYLRSRSPENRRKHERFRVNTDVRLRVGDKELLGAVTSLSMGGVQIDTDALLEKGGVVSLAITTPDGKEQIQVDGRIVWSETQKAYGVEFANASTTAMDRLRAWTNRLKGYSAG